MPTLVCKGFNQLRTTFDTGAPSAAVEVDFAESGETLRYYAAAIDADTMAVIEQDPAELVELIDSTASVGAVLSGVSVGQSGYVSGLGPRLPGVLSPQCRVCRHHIDALDAGIDVADPGTAASAG